MGCSNYITSKSSGLEFRLLIALNEQMIFIFPHKKPRKLILHNLVHKSQVSLFSRLNFLLTCSSLSLNKGGFSVQLCMNSIYESPLEFKQNKDGCILDRMAHFFSQFKISSIVDKMKSSTPKSYLREEFDNRVFTKYTNNTMGEARS